MRTLTGGGDRLEDAGEDGHDAGRDLFPAFDHVGMRVRLARDTEVGGCQHRGREVRVEVEADADDDVRADGRAQIAQKVALDVGEPRSCPWRHAARARWRPARAATAASMSSALIAR